MTRRILSILAAIVFAASSMLCAVSAAGSMALVQSQTPAPRETFQIHVLLSDNPGIKSLQCMITYDANSASLVSCVDGEYFDHFTQIPTDGGMFLIWSSDSNNDNYSSGILATITFIASSNPADGSLVSLTVLEALNANGSAVTVNGTTSVMQFDAEESDDTVSADDEGEEDDDAISADDEEELEDEGGVVAGDEEEDEDDIVSADDEEEEVTTASTSSTKATTTTKKTSATTTTEKKTSATTTEATTTTTEVTTSATTSATTPETTPEVTSTTPESEPEHSVSFSGDAHTVAAQKKKANGTTVFAAVMIVGITVAAIAGMEIWKRGEEQ